MLWNSPAHSRAFLATITAITSFITAAAAIVPCIIFAHSGAGPFKTETAIPVNTNDTPECGSNVSPKYFFTTCGERVIAAPKNAPLYFPTALDII